MKEDIQKTEAAHYVMDLYQIANYKLLDDMDYCLSTLSKAIESVSCEVLNIYQHKFSPQGISINATLSESHCAIRTWPEHAYCSIDFYSCGEKDLKKGVDCFINAFNPKKIRMIELKRGHEHDN